MSNSIRNIFFIVGIIAIAIMVLTMDISFSELYKDVISAGYWLVAILSLWGMLYMLNAMTWKVIIKGSGDCPVPFWKLVKITVTAFALNYATPFGLLGGEPYKIMEMKPYIGLQRASSSVLLFTMMHIFSHFWFWMISIFTYIILAIMGHLVLDMKMGIILSLMGIFCSTGIFIFMAGYRFGMVRKVLGWLSHIPLLGKKIGRFRLKHDNELKNIDNQISDLHKQNIRSFYASFFLELLGRLLQSFEILFMLIIFGTSDFSVYGFTCSFLILSFTTLLANLLFFMPLQLGGREGGFALSTAQMGMTNEIGIFISIICRVRELFWTTIGILLMKLGNSEEDAPKG